MVPYVWLKQSSLLEINDRYSKTFLYANSAYFIQEVHFSIKYCRFRVLKALQLDTWSITEGVHQMAVMGHISVLPTNTFAIKQSRYLSSAVLTTGSEGSMSQFILSIKD